MLQPAPLDVASIQSQSSHNGENEDLYAFSVQLANA